MEDGGAEGSRTPYLLIANEALYQVSYSPVRDPGRYSSGRAGQAGRRVGPQRAVAGPRAGLFDSLPDWAARATRKGRGRAREALEDRAARREGVRDVAEGAEALQGRPALAAAHVDVDARRLRAFLRVSIMASVPPAKVEISNWPMTPLWKADPARGPARPTPWPARRRARRVAGPMSRCQVPAGISSTTAPSSSTKSTGSTTSTPALVGVEQELAGHLRPRTAGCTPSRSLWAASPAAPIDTSVPGDLAARLAQRHGEAAAGEDHLDAYPACTMPWSCLSLSSFMPENDTSPASRARTTCSASSRRANTPSATAAHGQRAGRSWRSPCCRRRSRR